MKGIFENKYCLTEEHINMPLLMNDIPIGVVTKVDEDNFTMLIFDKFVGFEFKDDMVDAIYLSDKEQTSYKKLQRILRKQKSK